MSRGPARAHRALALLAALCAAGPARGLSIREGFEWDWDPVCVDRGTQWSSCFGVAGCANGRDLFVRRTNPGVCDYGSEVRFWLGAPALAPPAPPPPLRDQPSRWVASHVRDPRFRAPNGNTFEIMASREKQSSRFGHLQVDFHLDEDVPSSGLGEHYLVMHNLNLHGVVPCPPDGPGCEAVENARSNVGGVPGNPDSYMWYGVIAGTFGSGSAAIPYGSVGFVVEVSAEGATGNHLIDASFLPYSVGGRQDAFPRGTYRVAIARSDVDGRDIYEYSVLRWSPAQQAWEPIVPDRLGKTRSHSVRVPFRALVEPLGFEIPAGYVGLGAAWFGEASPNDAAWRRIDWDNLVVDW